MQISITGHHVDITAALHSYVNSKFERLARHFDQVTNVHVVLSVENNKTIKANERLPINVIASAI